MIDVIALAREAGYVFYDLTETHRKKTVETDEADEWAQLERFAALVQQATALECAALITARYFTENPESNRDAEDMRLALDCTDAILLQFGIGAKSADWNFCPACGKRLGGAQDVHTCSPPATTSKE